MSDIETRKPLHDRHGTRHAETFFVLLCLEYSVNVSLLSLCERGALLPVMDGRVWRRGSAASEYGVVPSLLLDVIDS